MSFTVLLAAPRGFCAGSSAPFAPWSSRSMLGRR